MTSIQRARVANKPLPELHTLAGLLKDNWGFTVAALKVLDSYDDANFFLRATSEGNSHPEEYLVKFYNAIESKNPAFLQGLSQGLSRLSHPPLSPILVPQIVAPLNIGPDNYDFIFVPCRTVKGESIPCAMRVFRWISGDTLNSHAAGVQWPNFVQVGNAIGRLQDTLHGFDHVALHREHIWDLRQFPLAASDLVSFVPDPTLQKVIQSVFQIYQSLIPADAFAFTINETGKNGKEQLPWSVIMGDANDANLIVHPTTREITGIIDFSDTMTTWRINEIAIALAYGAVTPFEHVSMPVVLASLFLGYLGLSVPAAAASDAAPAAHDHTHHHDHHHKDACAHGGGCSHTTDHPHQEKHEHDHQHTHHHEDQHQSSSSCCGHRQEHSEDHHHHHEHKHEHQHEHKHEHKHDHDHHKKSSAHHSHDHDHIHVSAVPAETQTHLRSLTLLELSLLPLLMAVRLSTSVMVGAFSIAENPENAEYLQLHATPGRRALATWCLGTNTVSDDDTIDTITEKIKARFAQHQAFFERLYEAARDDSWPLVSTGDTPLSDERTGHTNKRSRWSWTVHDHGTGVTDADVAHNLIEKRDRIDAIVRLIYDESK